MPTVTQGQEITLSAQFYSPSSGAPADPTSIQFQIVFEGATPSVVVGPLNMSQLVHTGAGAYQYVWNSPTNANLGTYQEQWIASIEGIPQYNFKDFYVISPTDPSVEEPEVVAALSTDPHILVGVDRLSFKFDVIPRAVSVYQGEYDLYQVVGQTDTKIQSPFHPIQAQDYNSISRVLSLYLNTQLANNAQYALYVKNIVDAAGLPVPDQKYLFAVTSVQPAVIPLQTPVYVADYSISETSFTSLDRITELNPSFYIVATDPDFDTWYLDTAYKNGRITITFSSPPLGNFVNTNFFLLQYKLLSREFAPWSTVPGIQVSVSSTQSAVYLDLPSLGDATPVFGEVGRTYFLPNARYRLKISKNVSTALG